MMPTTHVQKDAFLFQDHVMWAFPFVFNRHVLVQSSLFSSWLHTHTHVCAVTVYSEPEAGEDKTRHTQTAGHEDLVLAEADQTFAMSKKLLGAPGRTTRSKDATRGSPRFTVSQ